MHNVADIWCDLKCGEGYMECGVMWNVIWNGVQCEMWCIMLPVCGAIWKVSGIAKLWNNVLRKVTASVIWNVWYGEEWWCDMKCVLWYETRDMAKNVVCLEWCQRWDLMPQWQCYTFHISLPSTASHQTHLAFPAPTFQHGHIIPHFNLWRLPGHTSHGVMWNRVVWNLVRCGMFCNVRCASCPIFNAAVMWNKARCRICATWCDAKCGHAILDVLWNVVMRCGMMV